MSTIKFCYDKFLPTTTSLIVNGFVTNGCRIWGNKWFNKCVTWEQSRLWNPNLAIIPLSSSSSSSPLSSSSSSSPLSSSSSSLSSSSLFCSSWCSSFSPSSLFSWMHRIYFEEKWKIGKPYFPLFDHCYLKVSYIFLNFRKKFHKLFCHFPHQLLDKPSCELLCYY